jgi:acetyl esterase/lipase
VRQFYGNQASQFVDFRRPAEGTGRPLIVNIHGGFWRVRYDLQHAEPLYEALASAGFATANIEYRRVGEPGGGWPGTFDDVKRAVAFAREHATQFGGDPLRTIVLGHSAGGHLALWVAAEIRELAAVVGLAPVASLHQTLSDNAVGDLMGGAPDEVPDRYTYADPARPTPVPRILIHGTADDIVPIALSRGYVAPARLIEIPGADHFAVIDPDHAAFTLVLESLTHMAGRAGTWGSIAPAPHY